MNSVTAACVRLALALTDTVTGTKGEKGDQGYMGRVVKKEN